MSAIALCRVTRKPCQPVCPDCARGGLWPADAALVAVSPDVARLIEAVGPDNLPALLRVALAADRYWHGAALDPAIWERLGEALGGAS